MYIGLTNRGKYMIVYKDMTFCPFYRDCVNALHCVRPLTPEVARKAKECDMVIAQFISKPPCWANTTSNLPSGDVSNESND